MEKKENDVKFIVGIIILLVIFGVVGGSFWNLVAKQAEKDKQEEARLEQEAIRAIYVEAGDVLKEMVFVDMDKKTVFKADIPKEGIYNRNDKLIAGDTLENGDMVKVYGDGNMTKSIPASYPGVTKMKRNGRATLEELQPAVSGNCKWTSLWRQRGGRQKVKYLRQFCIILLISALGEGLHILLPLPVPASVYGLVLMLGALTSGILKLEQVEDAADFLVEIMPVMFVPAGVGLLEAWGDLQPIWLPVVIITILTTVIVMVVTGRSTQFVIKKDRRKDKK